MAPLMASDTVADYRATRRTVSRELERRVHRDPGPEWAHAWSEWWMEHHRFKPASVRPGPARGPRSRATLEALVDALRPAFDRRQPIRPHDPDGLFLDRMLRVFENGSLGATVDGDATSDDPEALVLLAVAAAWMGWSSGQESQGSLRLLDLELKVTDRLVQGLLHEGWPLSRVGATLMRAALDWELRQVAQRQNAPVLGDLRWHRAPHPVLAAIHGRAG